MAPLTHEQSLSRVLLRAFCRSANGVDCQDLQLPYQSLMAKVPDNDYAICLAWAAEQAQLIAEDPGYLPLLEQIEP